MPISKGCNQLVMIGDFQKNPPFLFSKLAASKGMGVSLF
jgi:superfamily I DNA and/or RNA helicase